LPPMAMGDMATMPRKNSERGLQATR